MADLLGRHCFTLSEAYFPELEGEMINLFAVLFLVVGVSLVLFILCALLMCLFSIKRQRIDIFPIVWSLKNRPHSWQSRSYSIYNDVMELDWTFCPFDLSVGEVLGNRTQKLGRLTGPQKLKLFWAILLWGRRVKWPTDEDKATITKINDTLYNKLIFK